MRLRAVPESPRRAVGYIRVSMAREEMISPELQRASIESHCERRGFVLVDVIEDLDRTGRNFAREGVQRAIERIEAGDAEVIVVWKVSRFGRTRRDWYVHADRVEVAGGSLESATEGFDATTPHGRFTRGMFVEMASLESDLIGETWREVHQHRLTAGLPHTGGKRFGYVYADGAYAIDPVTGPLLAECYQRYVAGQSPRRICEWLNAAGVRTTAGGQWRPAVMRDLLGKGFGAGFLFTRGELVEGSHPPVIDPKTWQAYQRRRHRAATTPTRAQTYPLSGLVYCATCGHRMQMWNGWVGTRKNVRQSAYRCPPDGCGHNYVATEILHAEVKAWLAAEVAAEIDDRAAVKARALARQTVAKTDIRAIEQQAREVTKAIARLTDGWSRGIVPEAPFRAQLEALEAERAGLDVRVQELSEDVAATRQRSRPKIRSLVRDYDLLAEREPDGLREVLHALLAGLLVTRGDHRHLGPRKVRPVSRWA